MWRTQTSVRVPRSLSPDRLTLYVDMIIDNDPPITRSISVPRDMSQLSCSSFSAGIVEAVLDGLGFVSIPVTTGTTSLTNQQF